MKLTIALLLAVTACAQTDVRLPAPVKAVLVPRVAMMQTGLTIGAFGPACVPTVAVCQLPAPIGEMTHQFTLAAVPAVGTRICVTMRRDNLLVNQQCAIAPTENVTDQLLRRTVRMVLSGLLGGETFDFSYETEGK